MKKTDAKQILKNKYCVVMLSCILIGIIVTLAVFFKDSGRVSAVSSILFTFEGAADGHTPDGEEFDIRMLAEDAILEAALEACNMKEKYTPEQLRSSLYIRGDYPENIAGELMKLYPGEAHRQEVVEKLKLACRKLGAPGASQRVAERILNAAREFTAE